MSGQADIGVGALALIQKVNAPIRMFYQLSMLRFYPVVNGEYKTWTDLDGANVAVSRGSDRSHHAVDGQGERREYARSATFPVRASAPARCTGPDRRPIVDYERKRLLQQEAPAGFVFLPFRTSRQPTRRCTPTRTGWIARAKPSTSWSKS